MVCYLRRTVLLSSVCHSSLFNVIAPLLLVTSSCRLSFPPLGRERGQRSGGGDRIGGLGEGWKGRLRDEWFLERVGVCIASFPFDEGTGEERERGGGVRSWDVMWGFFVGGGIFLCRVPFWNVRFW